MAFKLRFLQDVDSRLKGEMVLFGRWLRKWYDFPVNLEVRMISTSKLTDSDGSKCHLRWWQKGTERPVIVEIAVGRFTKNLNVDGPEVAYPTAAAAIGRGLKYYFLLCHSAPVQEDDVDQWGDQLVDAYIEGTKPPQPWNGAWTQ